MPFDEFFNQSSKKRIASILVEGAKSLGKDRSKNCAS